jgi:hypothetical protein
MEKITVDEIMGLENQIEFEMLKVLDLMQCRVAKIIEAQKIDMGQYVFDALKDQNEKRYAEIRDCLKDEFLMRFNDEIFLTNHQSVPIIPTKIDCHIDADIINHNRENFHQYFIVEKLLG